MGIDNELAGYVDLLNLNEITSPKCSSDILYNVVPVYGTYRDLDLFIVRWEISKMPQKVFTIFDPGKVVVNAFKRERIL